MFKAEGTTKPPLHWPFSGCAQGESAGGRHIRERSGDRKGQDEKSEEAWRGARWLPKQPSSHCAPPPPWARTCRSYSSEVVGPAQHHAGPVAGALNQRPGQGREQEDHSQVQHRHEEGEVETLYGVQSTGGAGGVERWPRLAASSLPPLLGGRGANSVLHEGFAAYEALPPTLQLLGSDSVPILEVIQRAGGRASLNRRVVPSLPPTTACQLPALGPSHGPHPGKRQCGPGRTC